MSVFNNCFTYVCLILSFFNCISSHHPDCETNKVKTWFLLNSDSITHLKQEILIWPIMTKNRKITSHTLTSCMQTDPSIFDSVPGSIVSFWPSYLIHVMKELLPLQYFKDTQITRRKGNWKCFCLSDEKTTSLLNMWGNKV